MTNAKFSALASMFSLGILLITTSFSSAQTYVPLLDEYDGVTANTGRYLILPAFENTNPNVRRKAYFIFPKSLQYSGDESLGTINLGVNHIGYSLLPDGSADYSPRIAIVATIEAIGDSKIETAIKQELTKRDIAEGFLEPAFPTPTFADYELNTVTAGVSERDDKDLTVKYPGGYPGQPFLINAHLYTGANRAFVLETPPNAGRDANLWGVAVRGRIHGYGNRLDCTITMKHSQVYDYFAGRASAQAYWGAVKADVSNEVRKMDDDKVIDFGPCRGNQEKIDKLVMPAWQMIIDMQNDDGEKMFYQMVREVTTGSNHPGESQSGWGFQASAKWAKVSKNKSVTFNFNVADQLDWTLPMAMSFSSSCSAYKSNFINGSDPKKSCVDAKDAARIKAAQRNCFIQFAQEISKLSLPEDITKKLLNDLNRDGCGFDFTDPSLNLSITTVQELQAQFSSIRTRVKKMNDDIVATIN